MWLLIQMAPLAAKVKMLGIYLSLLFVYNNIIWTLGGTKFLKVLKHSKKKSVYVRRHVILSIYGSDQVCKNISALTQRQTHQPQNIWPPPSLEDLPVNHLCGMNHSSNKAQQLSKIPRNTVNRDYLFKVLKETHEGIPHFPPPPPVQLRVKCSKYNKTVCAATARSRKWIFQRLHLYPAPLPFMLRYPSFSYACHSQPAAGKQFYKIIQKQEECHNKTELEAFNELI